MISVVAPAHDKIFQHILEPDNSPGHRTSERKQNGSKGKDRMVVAGTIEIMR